MPIRLKVLSIAFALLIIFGIVITYSTIQHHRLAAEIEAIGHYNMPLRTALSDFDVLSDEYELIALRLLRRPNVPKAEIESEIARAKKDAEKLMEYATTMSSILDQAVADEQVPEEPRRDYAELKSALPFIVRHLDTLIQTGERVFEAIGKGHTEEARTLSLE